jgi:mono/diheme cytochrome c family protein
MHIRALAAVWGLALLAGCRTAAPPAPAPPEGPVYRILPAPQSQSGDPEAGFRYLIYGSYIGSGLPIGLFAKLMERYEDTVFRREGPAGRLPYLNNVLTVPNGVTVTSGNCFTCHAGRLNGRVIPGLGDSWSDYTRSQARQIRLAKLFMRMRYGRKSPEWEAASMILPYYKALTPRIITEQYGVNPAFRLEEACVAQRRPADLTYQAEPGFAMNTFNIACDVPPLWHVRKKQALYYTGMGRGDFTKLLMQASVLGIPDSSAARQAQEQFDDVLAWLRTLEPPAWPYSIDRQLAAQGEQLYLDACSKCHGRYGDHPEYPSRLEPLDKVGTDPLYARYFLEESGLAGWYNQSWFAQSPPRSEMKPSAAYIAPPLDGIWATAPYLHNGSVPTLEALLNSPERPVYWLRSESSSSYDSVRVGWQYTVPDRPRDPRTYNTRLPGYGNQGHTYGDTLSAAGRRAVIEYLKTL